MVCNFLSFQNMRKHADCCRNYWWNISARNPGLYCVCIVRYCAWLGQAKHFSGLATSLYE